MKIFNIKKEKTHTVIYVLGIKLSFKRRLKEKKNLEEIYDESFYSTQAEESYKSALEILNLLSKFNNNPIKSVLDVGCGVGTWLKAWQDIDKDVEITGIDVNQLGEELLYIPRKCIIESNLTNADIELLRDKRYDLVESLEVGEHLSSEDADSYVSLLSKYSDLILFSAAIPCQTGTHHINEQPPQYWNEKFKKQGYECFDILRNRIWNNSNIRWWYRQNIVIYARNEDCKRLKENGFVPTDYVNNYYHPELVKMYNN